MTDTVNVYDKIAELREAQRTHNQREFKWLMDWVLGEIAAALKAGRGDVAERWQQALDVASRGEGYDQ